MGEKAPKTEKCVCGSWFVVDAYPDGHICYPAQATKALRKQLAIAVKAINKHHSIWGVDDQCYTEGIYLCEALKQIEELNNVEAQIKTQEPNI